MPSHKRIGETTYKETTLGIIPRSELILLEIEGIKRAWDFVIEQNLKGKIRLTIPFIKKAHLVGFGWIFPKWGGSFRIIDVTISNYAPPKHYLVPQLMEDFIRDLGIRLKHLPTINQQVFFESLIDLLAWSHHHFLWIHPFQDYNGRIARLLINMILFKFDFPPIEMKIETESSRKKYVHALQKADQGDYTELKKLIHRAMEETAKELDQ